MTAGMLTGKELTEKGDGMFPDKASLTTAAKPSPPRLDTAPASPLAGSPLFARSTLSDGCTLPSRDTSSAWCRVHVSRYPRR